MRHEILLIYDADCPNVDAARENLREAVGATGQGLSWKEINRADPATPWRIRQFGSPTILIDGRDVAGTSPGASGDCCRVYASGDGRFAGAPSVERIRAALGSATHRSGGGWRGPLLAIPAVAMALLPSVTCPACWPAYAALLGTLGIGFVPSDRLLLPLMVAALVLVLAAFAWRAVRFGRFGALALGGAAAAILVVGRFVTPWPLLQYAGALGLVAASIWNIALRPRAAALAKCPNCVPVVRRE